MFSDNNKKKVEKGMKNVEVVKGKRKTTTRAIVPKEQGVSADELKKKYLSDDSGSKQDRLRKKFLDKTEKRSMAADDAAADSVDSTEEDKDVEVGLIKKKNQDAATDAVDERTIIISNKDGMLGAQG